MNGLNKFTAKEERLLLSLAMVVFIGVIFFYIINKFDRPELHHFEQTEAQSEKWKNKDFEKKVKQTFPKKATVKVYSKFPFNPNTIGKDSLQMLGVDERTASNLIKYREKGGKIKTADKFFKIYGMESYREQLLSLLSFDQEVAHNAKRDIQDSLHSSIANQSIPAPPSPREFNNTSINNTSTSKSYPPSSEKPYSKPLKIVEINSADSTQLESVRGIGWYLANKIIKYRERLGGFYNINQLEEIYGMRPESFLEIKDQLKIDIGNIRPININTIDAVQLGKHPYIGKRFAEITILYRNNHGKFKSMEDVAKVKIFEQETLDKIKYYISFE